MLGCLGAHREPFKSFLVTSRHEFTRYKNVDLLIPSVKFEFSSQNRILDRKSFAITSTLAIQTCDFPAKAFTRFMQGSHIYVGDSCSHGKRKRPDKIVFLSFQGFKVPLLTPCASGKGTSSIWPVMQINDTAGCTRASQPSPRRRGGGDGVVVARSPPFAGSYFPFLSSLSSRS